MKYNVSGLSNRRGLAEARSEVISKTLSKKSISNFIDNTTNKPEDINLDEYEYYYNYYQEIHHKDEKNDTNSIVLNSTDYLDIIRKIFYNISALDLSEKLITTEINIQDTEYVQLLQDISIEKKQESYDKIEKNLDIINQYSEDINNKLILFTSYYYYYLNYFTLLKKYGCSNNIVLKLNELVKNINKEFEESILTKYNIKLTEYNESSTSSSSSNTNSDTIKEYNNKYITNNYILYKILFYYCIKYFSLNDNLNQNLMLLNMISEDFLLLLRNSLQENNNINTSIINDEILFNEFNQYFYTKISTFDEILFTKTEEKNPDNVENKNENENTNEKDENISDLLKISLYNMLKKLNIIRKNLIIIKEEEKIKKLKYKKHTLLINFINNKKKSKISSYSLINSASGSDADSSHISPVIPSQSLINLKVNYPKNQLTQRFHTLISGEDAYHDVSLNLNIFFFIFLICLYFYSTSKSKNLIYISCLTKFCLN